MKLRAIRIMILACVGGVATGGCVERKLTVTSEPSGALVFMNDREIGRTPIETDFVYYGNYDVQVRKDGYTTIDQGARLRTPWWQIPPIDLLAEFAPWHPTDRQTLSFTLTPRPPNDRPVDDIVVRGVALGRQLESPLHPPATAPSTAPAATGP